MRRDEPLYIDVRAFRRAVKKTGPATLGLVMDLISHVWCPTQPAFDFDAAVEYLTKIKAARDMSVALGQSLRTEAATFFVILEDGRWAPSPAIFSLSDGNPGALLQ